MTTIALPTTDAGKVRLGAIARTPLAVASTTKPSEDKMLTTKFGAILTPSQRARYA